MREKSKQNVHQRWLHTMCLPTAAGHTRNFTRKCSFRVGVAGQCLSCEPLGYVGLTCLIRQGLPLGQSMASSGHSLPASLRCVIYKEAVHVHFPLAPSHHHLCSQLVHIGTSYKGQCPFAGWGFILGRNVYLCQQPSGNALYTRPIMTIPYVGTSCRTTLCAIST